MSEKEIADEGLTPREVAELMEYVQLNNSWTNLFSLCETNRPCPKYIDFCVDTRSGDMWSITFRQVANNKETEIGFRTYTGYSFKEAIYHWLNTGEYHLFKGELDDKI